MNTDYTIRSARRTEFGWVTYVVVDRYGNVLHVTVPFSQSTLELADPIIRRTVSQWSQGPRKVYPC